MKTLTIYECEVCGTSYNSKESCRKCEESHIHCSGIKKEHFKAYGMGEEVPHEIEVLFLNGLTAKYLFSGYCLDK